MLHDGSTGLRADCLFVQATGDKTGDLDLVLKSMAATWNGRLRELTSA